MIELKNIPRIILSNLETPLEKCKRLPFRFPDAPDIYIKRDDFIGSLVWGNKLRKLEFTLADAMVKGADTIITCGGVQSNHARTTAQVCKRLGLECILVQNGVEPEIPTGNHKINRMLNIPIHYVSNSEDRNGKMTDISEKLKSKGRNPYIIPLGASDEIGCLGLAFAVQELKKQQDKLGIKFDYLVHATSSGGTQAGLEIGKRLYGLDDLKIIGISADNTVDELSKSILGCTEPAIEKLNLAFSINKEDINIDTSFIGDGYGLPTEKSEEAKQIFADMEGIMLDTTYTAKAAAGLLDYIRRGKFQKGQKVVFWHTGGILAEL